jgi:hypothetical protein
LAVGAREGTEAGGGQLATGDPELTPPLGAAPAGS